MRKLFQIIGILLLAVSLTYGVKAEASDSEIRLSSGRDPNEPSQKFLNLVYAEAFKRLGLVYKYEQVPWKRSSMFSDSGEVDGEVTRTYSYGDKHPNVIRVEESHYTSGFIALATNPLIQLNGWKSLENTGYFVEYVRGSKGQETNLPKYVKPHNLSAITSINQGVNRLILGRTDVFVGTESGLSTILRSGIVEKSDIQIVGIMHKYTAHAFLHKKHKDLEPKLSSVLKKMKKEGLFNKYRKVTGYTTLFNPDGSIKQIPIRN
ncbi:MAG: transporter substrate-binding domain-containing protein [Deltaproteobacteria bacterium]|nr:transporter substrate-binding domain-containing protein [Deltaproteobacteria bacterium]